MDVEGGEAMRLSAPCFTGIVRTAQVEQLHLTVKTNYRQSELHISSADALESYLADINCAPNVGCQRTFDTHDAWSAYVRTMASSSSNRRSKTLTTPSAKLATNVWDDPESDEMAVTGLSEFVSKS